ncbi:hypothetical protein P692DRAFT_20358833 [Suillus brevipes Sb2]|nr:hypothetical protein P692DRAFT_20358833 [Suillus brevipes Sb2]
MILCISSGTFFTIYDPQKCIVDPLNSDNSSSQRPNPGVTQQCSTTAPDATASASSSPPTAGGTTTMSSPRHDVVIRQAGRWTRFWICICFYLTNECNSPCRVLRLSVLTDGVLPSLL